MPNVVVDAGFEAIKFTPVKLAALRVVSWLAGLKSTPFLLELPCNRQWRDR